MLQHPQTRNIAPPREICRPHPLQQIVLRMHLTVTIGAKGISLNLNGKRPVPRDSSDPAPDIFARSPRWLDGVRAMTRLTSMGSLRAPERAATLYLRGGDPDDLSDVQADFTALRQGVRALDLTVLEPASRYLAPDEIEVLSWLTLFQQNPSFAEEVAPQSIAPSLAACARKLTGAGRRLHINATLRLKNPAAKPQLMIPVPHKSTERAFLRLPSPTSVQGRALRHIAALGTADTRGLAERGFSRQLIGLMLQHGLVRRVGHGKYSAAPEVATALAQSANGE